MFSKSYHAISEPTLKCPRNRLREREDFKGLRLFFGRFLMPQLVRLICRQPLSRRFAPYAKQSFEHSLDLRQFLMGIVVAPRRSSFDIHLVDGQPATLPLGTAPEYYFGVHRSNFSRLRLLGSGRVISSRP